MKELNREQIKKDLQEIVDNYSGSWKGFNVLDNALALIKELTVENERLEKEVDRLSQVVLYHDGITEMEVEETKVDTVHKMQAMIKEECIAGGIWPAFVARVVENVVKKLLEESNG